jgi:glycosyltransferase involved in cell wall biosynthesis
MRICIFGKFPPIQGGVSTRTYWLAHRLAMLGHAVHVVTNAKEGTLPYRMLMRGEDWQRCEGRYGEGSVTVHWTDYDRREWHIPDGTTWVTKLASLGLDVVRSQRIDVILSYYVEPYGVAAHFVAQATGVPHVLRTAGSDAGRLWSLPQFAALYDHVFRSADAIVCSPAVAPKMIEIGVDPWRLAWNREKHASLHDLFTPEGPVLDVELLWTQAVADESAGFRTQLFGSFDPALHYVGVYGKLGQAKGTRQLVGAIKRMRDHGLRVGLLAMAHERPSTRDSFRELVTTAGMENVVCQIPFLPHWRVPEFIRRCVAVCCLEQNFPIKFHDPVVAREILTCGGCLVGSAEVLGKLPDPGNLVDERNCIAIADVDDVDNVARRLTSIVENPDRSEKIRRQARQYAIDIEARNGFPRRFESILSDISRARRLSSENIRPDFAGPAPHPRGDTSVVAAG